MNSVVIMGRATSAFELKSTPTGKSVASGSLAVKRPFAKDTVDFINIVAWDKQAEILSKYVNKGSMICVRGSLQVRNWTDNDGKKRYATEVMVSEVSFAESKKASDNISITREENASESFVEVEEEGLPF